MKFSTAEKGGVAEKFSVAKMCKGCYCDFCRTNWKYNAGESKCLRQSNDFGNRWRVKEFTKS